MRRTLIFVLLLVVAASGCDWSQIYGNASHTNANTIEPKFSVANASRFTLDWEINCFCITPVSSAGIVYTADGYSGVAPRNVTLRAINATDGSERWRFTLELIDSAEFVAVGNGLAYVLLRQTDDNHQEDDNVVLAFDARSGALRWGRSAPHATTATVILDGEALVVVNGNGIMRLDTSGNIVWSASSPGVVETLAADPGRNIYVSSNIATGSPAAIDSYITRYDEGSGASIEFAHFRKTGDTRPAGFSDLRVANGLLYFNRCPYCILAPPGEPIPSYSAALRLDTGATAWSAPGETLAAVTGKVAIFAGQITRPGGFPEPEVSGDLIARDPSTGAVKWRRAGAGHRGWLIAGDLLFDGFQFRSLANGSPVGTLPADGGSPIPANGQLFSTGGAVLQAWSPTSS